MGSWTLAGGLWPRAPPPLRLVVLVNAAASPPARHIALISRHVALANRGARASRATRCQLLSCCAVHAACDAAARSNDASRITASLTLLSRLTLRDFGRLLPGLRQAGSSHIDRSGGRTWWRPGAEAGGRPIRVTTLCGPANNNNKKSLEANTWDLISAAAKALTYIMHISPDMSHNQNIK